MLYLGGRVGQPLMFSPGLTGEPGAVHTNIQTQGHHDHSVELAVILVFDIFDPLV